MTPRAVDVYMSSYFRGSNPFLEKTWSGNTLITIMENEGSGENTDDLLSAEEYEAVDVYGLIPLSLSHDHCDALLDSIDTQLSHLQIHSQNRMQGGNPKIYELPFSGYLDWSHSVSKDTGLGSTVPTNDKTPSNLEETQSESKDDQTEHQKMEMIEVGVTATDVWCPEGRGSMSSVSRVEQCCWRLERLLGINTEVAGMGNEEDDLTMDSICTEDFSTRFREEMLVPSASGIPMQSFDSVTIDTDLETVSSEQVQQHLNSALSNKTAFHLSRENGYCTGQTSQIQNSIQSFSSDDERTVEETSSEGVVSKLDYRRRRHSSGRKGKRRRLYQNKRNDSYIGTKKDRGKSRIDEDQVKELSMSLTEIQREKTATLHTLKKLREEVDRAKKEHLSLQLSVKDSRAQAQDITCELQRLQAQRNLFLKEVRVLQEQQCASRSVSVLEREEMDRLLGNAKSELFSEQRRFRHKLDSVHERLDEVNQELEQSEEDCRALRQKCTELEEKLADAIRENKQIKETSQKDLEQQVKSLGALERTVAQKELLLQRTEDAKEGLLQELCSLREEHSFKLREMQNKKEQEIEQLTLQLTKSQKEELQKVHQQADELRSAALSEQAQSHKQSLDFLHNCIQMKDEEIERLKEVLEQHEEKMRKQAEELNRETQEKIRKAVKREERKWEEQREKALKEQRGPLEQQIEEAVKRGKTEVEKERRNTLALQSKVTELQKEAEKKMVHLKQTLQRSEKELQELKKALSEKDQKHQRRTARLEQQSQRWAQDIHSECVRLQELLAVDNKNSSDSPTVSETLQTLPTLTKALQQHINDLKDELNSQRCAALQLSREKEQELHLQKQQLMDEKERALAALKEKLIQEHIEEMSSISRAQLHMNHDDTDELCVHLRRQLKAKDDELRRLQNNMTQWKDKTTARLAHKFELELKAELERRVPKPRAEQQKRLERLENEMRHLTGQCQDYNEYQSASTALQGGTEFQNSQVTQDPTSYKLLQHLQSRIRQLRAESQTRCPSPVKWDRNPTALGGSYLDTIAPSLDSYRTEDHLPAKTVSS
ncbi:golgin subfamily A member 4 isoform X2 [Carassius carassius]|uniref:golgin subfamily A member 4 isoform X2 n=1 Tax=Carassius carassius TaxID=217509 RepID=UPI002868F78C|nr:golgin subfamily A member 4 isoform X2 [Carassius carassius]